MLLTIATVIVGLIPFVIIFYYQNRKRQLTITYLSILVIIAYSFWLATNARKEIGGVQLELGNYAIGAILPSLAILFLVLAARGIRRDEKLVRSADRLR